MSDREAFVRRIAETPDDDTPRLVFADWLEERDECDRDRATVEFVRLTCDLPAPKQAKTRECPACGNRVLYRMSAVLVNGEMEVRQENENLRDSCGTCGGKGRVPNVVAYRMYPKKAAEWLRGDWRRLLPLLTADWDDPSVVSCENCCRTRWERWQSRCYLKAGVPFLPMTPRPVAYRPEHGQFYVPVVRLIFGRGFLDSATWRAPTLGKSIAAWIAEDQPLARQSGPGAIGNGEPPIAPPAALRAAG